MRILVRAEKKKNEVKTERLNPHSGRRSWRVVMRGKKVSPLKRCNNYLTNAGGGPKLIKCPTSSNWGERRALRRSGRGRIVLMEL